jgi:hypothetical protein
MALYGLAAVSHLFHYQGKGIWHGLYLPTREMVSVFSKGRFGPILNAVGAHTGVACGDFTPKETESDEGGHRPMDAYNFKTIGKSHVYLAWTQGTLVDALPLDIVWLDEVRLMDPGRVDRIEKRIMGSEVGWVGFTSTAGLPGDAIDVRWEQSDQRCWHTTCGCKDGVELNKVWPNCLGERRGEEEPANRFFLYCPRCGQEIRDRSAGRWVAHNQGEGKYPGFAPHQLMTRQPLIKIVGAWHRDDRNTVEFYNSVLGLPFLDPDACPITADVLKACVNEDLLWARSGDVSRTALGIDQMGGVNYYVVTSRSPDGHRRLVHLEIGFSDDPFSRAGQLMRAFDVSIACVEPLPNYNDALRFSRAFPGRVFIVQYGNGMKDGQLVWGDRNAETPGKKVASSEVKTRYTVTIDRTKMLDALATHWKERRPEVPEPRSLLQSVPDEYGREFMVEVCQQVYFDHLQRIARRQVTEERLADGIDVPEETGRRRYHWVKLARSPSGTKPAPVKGAASDPHFAFADLMNFIAWTRLPQGERGVRVFYPR